MFAGAALALALTASQMHWLAVSYNIGQENGLGYTLSALSWQESSFCRNKVNGWSVGCLGTKRRTVRKLFDPAATRARLVSDDEYSIRAGLSILLYCKTQAQTWRRQIACYHFGEPTESKMSDEQIDKDPYVLSVAAKVRALEGVKQNHE